MKNYGNWVDEEFEVQCFHCKGKKGKTIKPKGKTWTFCPNCGAGLDIMNRIEVGKVQQ